MFEKNDKQLLTMRIIVNVVICIIAAASILVGIILSATASNAVFLLIAVGGAFLSWLTWVVARLYLSYLCDIKLIRNKLYGVDNDNLKVFLEEKQTPEQIAEQKRVAAQNAEKIEKLKTLRDSGVISEEEFQQEREKLLK